MTTLSENFATLRPAEIGFLGRLKSAFAQRRIYNKTHADLNALSTRELEDLGISRSMISRLAYEAAYGK